MLQVQHKASTDNAQTMAICEVQRLRITGRHATSMLIASWFGNQVVDKQVGSLDPIEKC